MSVHACLHVCLHAHGCAPVGCADLMTLDTMTPQERKRQGYIHELIQTEETYVEDLELVLEVPTETLAYLNIINTFLSFFFPVLTCLHLFLPLRSSTSPCPSQAV